MLSRREFVTASGAAAVSIAYTGHAADMVVEDTAVTQRRPRVLGRDFNGPLPSDLYIRGKFPPKTEEERIARDIINAAPTSSPLAIMRYFAGLTRVNAGGEAYNAGWAHRWNPVIVEFFTATTDTHSGDETPWCAAFLNWCLRRARYKGLTESASSGSFRDAPGRTTNKSVGDIVVYKSTGCQGHVALYLRTVGGSYEVIGGNQTDIQRHHSINIKKVPFPGSGLSLHSFHKISAFRPPISTPLTCT